MAKLEGIVDWFNKEKGYGFLKVNGRRDNLFVHVNELRASNIQSPLASGQKVRCNVKQSPRGNGECATDIELAA